MADGMTLMIARVSWFATEVMFDDSLYGTKLGIGIEDLKPANICTTSV